MGLDQQQQKRILYGLACTLSLLFFALQWVNDDILNDDGMDYIYAAHALSEGLPDKALSYRPETLFFSQITHVASLSGLSLINSALFISNIWQALLACGFVAIIRILGGSQQTQLLGLVVLFSVAGLNELRPSIIRGFGFWALQLWAVWAALAYIKFKAWRFAGLWLGLSALSLCYRHEGIIYLALIPLASLLVGQLPLRHKTVLLSLFLFAFAGLTFLATSRYYAPTENPQTSSFTRLQKLQGELESVKKAKHNFEHQKTAMAAAMPNKWGQRSVNDILIGGLFFHVLITLIKTSNAPLLLLSFWQKQTRPPSVTSSPEHKLLTAYLLTGLLVGLLAVYSKYFVSTRYIMLPALILCVMITFKLSQTLTLLRTKTGIYAKLWPATLALLALLAVVYPLIHSKNSKLYIKEAGQWVKHTLGDEQAIYFDNQKVAFYTDNYTNESFRLSYNNPQELLSAGYCYAVYTHSRKKQAHNAPPSITQNLAAHQIQSFANKRGDSITVYQLPQQSLRGDEKQTSCKPYKNKS